MCHPGVTWTEALPLVLLGVRSTFKDDVQSTAAELVYGAPLRLPGELLSKPSVHHLDSSAFIERLRRHMAMLRPVPFSNHAQTKPFIFKDLATCDYVFLRDDSLRGALQPPYSGPHRVISRGDKTVSILFNGKPVNVSLDRVKPAFVMAH